MHAIIVADGDVRPGPALSRALDGTGQSPLVVAADGGVLKGHRIGLRPDVVVGDGDSLSTEAAADLRDAGTDVLVYSTAKDESDTELAVLEAISRGATSITILGAFGGNRVEHTVANLLLLTLPALANVDAALVDGASTVRVIGVSAARSLAIQGAAGDYVSLLPLSERVEGVTTDGLRFPLSGETLVQGPARGLSNELLATGGSVRTHTGRLAVIHTVRADVEVEESERA